MTKLLESSAAAPVRTPGRWAFLLCYVALSPGLQAQSGAVRTGRVADTAGAPLAGVLVLADRMPESAVRTATDGSFRIEGLARGQRWLDFRAEGYEPLALPVTVEGPGQEDVGTVTLEAGPPLTVTLTGVVTDARTGAPLEDAEIMVNGRRIALSGATGAFRADRLSVTWGANRVAADLLGFARASREVWIIEPGQTIDVGLPLSTAPVELPGVLVEGGADEAPSTVMEAFVRRRATTSGYFLDRGEIAERNPDGLVTLLRTVPGVRVRPSVEGTEVTFTRRTATLGSFSQQMANDCRSPVIYLDGIPVQRDTREFVPIDELIAPEDVAGLEAYNGASRVPIEFNTIGSGCGVLVLWTRRGFLQPTVRPVEPAQVAPTPGGGRRKWVIGAIVVPIAIFAFKTAVCSLPHYCR